MGHEHLKPTREVPLVQNQHPIQAFRTDGTYKPLGHAVGLRRAKGRANDLDPVGSKHVVKSVRKFLVPITNHETDAFGSESATTQPF